MKKIQTFFNYFKVAVNNHKLALAGALIVGIIYIAPHIFFILSLGDDYQGIPVMNTANEDFYIARMQEIIDGHPFLGSPVFYEGKDQWPLTPPVGEMFYVLPSLIFNIPLIGIVIASRFVFSFIIFILVYFLINKLTFNSRLISNKINAIAGALLVTLGYDLVDYHTLWLFLTGKINSGYFLIWSRPVNPVIGAVLLFAFLLSLWSIIQQKKYKKTLIAVAGALLALMIGNYFFSWGIALSVLGTLFIIYVIEKKYTISKSLLAIVAIAITLTSPHWYFSWQLSTNPWYDDAVMRNGLFYTHYPLLNKLLLATLMFYAVTLIVLYWHRKTWPLWKERVINTAHNTKLQDWHLFCVALLLGGFWALNQQVVTGVTIWPFHFVQYTIPIVMITVCVLFYNLIKARWKSVWVLMVIIVICSSLTFGIFTQVKGYKGTFDYYASLQSYGGVFAWLNNQKKDCVVLTLDESNGAYDLNGLIPAFTHCNIYSANWVARPDRAYDSYLTLLRFKGVTEGDIGEYLQQHRREALAYLFSNWKSLFGIQQFPDVSDPKLEEKIKTIPHDYQQFMRQDFSEALNKYRLDYIVSLEPLKEQVIKQLSGTNLINEINGVFIYSFR
ncbi:hypothetical protein COU01_01485 [Candidatus Falkowbacteria bacterium CG10_big_fil_rev_8_21_14_0_10_44_15]|uniref:Glycosyltransferase RgtA/B/C/D-like domain-containing protein n=1 Tax=Candidatus Falkowbacteria bacterium CG10_big_fil_rev_8_21_14_0_10_44_15 TaxID=1974569 RepID=A0A2H0V247_9BACT|nr:MAG: hypothetical protein COU01_01485 [Candidatus Falkowbacteria bacterium CG10_big_fil_rev_8_21_14_0_10_44_15]